MRPPVPDGVLLAAGSGVLLGATFSPYGGPVLPFLAFAPLGAGLVGRAGGRGGAPFALGFVTAAVAHGMGLYWMVPALAWRTSLAAPAYLLVLVLIGMLAGAACRGAVSLHRRWRWPLPVALAACWTGAEWAAAHVPGLTYAWLSAGSSLAWQPALAAGSELLGARFLTVWTVGVGVWVGEGCAAWAGGALPRRITPRAALLLILAVLPAAVGHLRQRTLGAMEPAWRIAAVQPGRGGAPGGQPSVMPSGGELAQWQEPLRAAAAAEPFDIAVFPERFLASPLRDPGSGAPTPAGASLAAFANALGSPVLSGGVELEVRDDSRADTLWYNAAFLQSPGGALSPAYRKTGLVPGLEGSGWWPGSAPRFGARGYAPGGQASPLGDGAMRIGAMVCYDSAFGETARSLARQGAHWLAVVSNDDWLDPAGPFRATWAYWQHATHGRLRAIENRISLVQVAATGRTFAVAPDGAGEPYALEPGARGVVVLTASRRRSETLFTRTGDLLGLACLAVFAAGVVAAALRPAVERRTGR